MKKTLVAFTTLFACLLVGLIACQKEGAFDNLNNGITPKTSNQAVSDRGPKISIKGKLHRAIENRPRDGKECNCKACFGVCDVSIEIGYEFEFHRIVVSPGGPGTGTGQSVIYFLDSTPANAENEFAIDRDILLPNGALLSTPYTSVTLKRGSYQYDPTPVEIDLNGQLVTSFGSVVINTETR